MPSVYVEAPTEYAGDRHAIFLAGGITDCPDWQADARTLIDREVVLNPRRANFPIHDSTAAAAQIDWEFRHLHRASVVLFWFAPGPSPQPIALYELGRHAALQRRIAVGADPEYLRLADVHMQLSHARPELTVHDTLEATCREAVFLTRCLEAADDIERDPAQWGPIQDVAGMFWPRVEREIKAELRRREEARRQ